MTQMTQKIIQQDFQKMRETKDQIETNVILLGLKCWGMEWWLAQNFVLCLDTKQWCDPFSVVLDLVVTLLFALAWSPKIPEKMFLSLQKLFVHLPPSVETVVHRGLHRSLLLGWSVQNIPKERRNVKEEPKNRFIICCSSMAGSQLAQSVSVCV